MLTVDRMFALLRPADGGLREGLVASAPLLVAAIFAIVLAGQLAALLWRVVGPKEDAAPDPAAGVVAAPAIDLGSIVNAHLFGLATTAGDPLAAPATSANLTLAGTLAAQDPEQGWAIIGASAQAARVYAAGDALPGGARLLAVYPDRVILDRGGARESLALPRLTSGAGPVPVTRGPAPAPSASLADSVRELMAQNPGAANELIRPQPVFAGGQLRGYRVYPGRDRVQFAKLGLQPGDLVTAVNGAALDDPNSGLEALRGVGQGTAVTLTIDRNGQRQQLTVDPSAVAAELRPVSEAEPLPPPESTE